MSRTLIYMLYSLKHMESINTYDLHVNYFQYVNGIIHNKRYQATTYFHCNHIIVQSHHCFFILKSETEVYNEVPILLNEKLLLSKAELQSLVISDDPLISFEKPINTRRERWTNYIQI